MKPLMKLLIGITLGILLGVSVDAAVGTFTFKTPGASDTVEAVSLVYPQRVPEAGSVTTDSIADGSITNDKLAEPVSVANGGTGATTAAEGLAALGGASLNGSSTVDFSVNHAKAADGNRLQPSFSFASDSDTGVYRSANNTLALTAGGDIGLYTSGGNVAIGDAVSPSYKLRVANTATNTVCFYSFFNPPLLSGTAEKYYVGIQAAMNKHDIPADISNTGYLCGLMLDSYISDTNFKGTLANQYGAYISAGIYSGTGTISNCYALYLKNYNLSGTITNNWGLYQDTAAARNYFAGRTLFGTTTDDGVSAVQVAGGGLRLVGAAAPSTPAEGTLYFNSTNKHFYGYNGTEWVQLDNGD